ncbi:hypothetical protein AB0M47_02705 [Hamadaea sp. NPDC051192]|uniref:hypothetical protein n=1 Tax=Hamadaea sp. NPDC051192 TaxID=3154940 RepID=UPI003443A404
MSTRPVARRSALIGGAAPAAVTYLPRAALADAYPTFNGKTDFGAKGDGTTNDTKASTVTGPAVRWGNPATGVTGANSVGTYG